jgi:hypothetical protein
MENEISSLLASVAHLFTCCELAANVGTPKIVLKGLAANEFPRVRATVSQNTSAPVDTLVELANDADPNVRCGVALNPKTPLYLLKELAHDDESCVRRALAVNPKTPFNDFLRNPDWRAREIAAAWPDLAVESMLELQFDPIWQVREKLAKNPAAPFFVLDSLQTDECASVAIEARCQLRRR